MTQTIKTRYVYLIRTSSGQVFPSLPFEKVNDDFRYFVRNQISALKKEGVIDQVEAERLRETMQAFFMSIRERIRNDTENKGLSEIPITKSTYYLRNKHKVLEQARLRHLKQKAEKSEKPELTPEQVEARRQKRAEYSYKSYLKKKR